METAPVADMRDGPSTAGGDAAAEATLPTSWAAAVAALPCTQNAERASSNGAGAVEAGSLRATAAPMHETPSKARADAGEPAGVEPSKAGGVGPAGAARAAGQAPQQGSTGAGTSEVDASAEAGAARAGDAGDAADVDNATSIGPAPPAPPEALKSNGEKGKKHRSSSRRREKEGNKRDGDKASGAPAAEKSGKEKYKSGDQEDKKRCGVHHYR